jgi:Acyl-protein synthetase, LuxE
MNAELINFAVRVGRGISEQDDAFNGPALELFGLQFQYNPAYRRISEAKGLTPNNVRHWTEVPFVPTTAFKELELSCIPTQERTAVFHSSGTTEQKPSRHFHCRESLALYEKSLWSGFEVNVIGQAGNYDLLGLAPHPELVPRSSLVHMFETVRQQLAGLNMAFVGELDVAGAWTIDFDAALAALRVTAGPKLILGTAFSFVHLLDFLAGKNLRLQLPEGSRIMETGGYKNRSRAMPKMELHSLITEFLGIPRERIVCEYGMSELSSQAYDSCDSSNRGRHFHFPPWARAQIISPETGHDVGDGEMGLIRIFDLANVFSVAAIQTEDLAVRRGSGFELIGRATMVEPRGCSLMTA